MFGTHFTLEDGLSAYNINLNARLARKESKYLSRDEQLDLVIVVDRLLTGFDAPCVSTLFVDRGPMRPQNLIQAFSRTNRLFNNTKQYGQIVTFRYPAIFERDINDALFLYSHGGTNDVQAPTYEETKKKFEAALSTLREVAPQPADVEDLSTVVEKKRFAKAYQELDHALSEIQVYTEWNPDDLENVYHLDTTVLNNYSGKYRNVIEELRHTTDDDDTGDTDIPIDVEYELESVKMTEINYKYLIQLIQAHIPEYDELVVPRIEDKTIFTPYIRRIPNWPPSSTVSGQISSHILNPTVASVPLSSLIRKSMISFMGKYRTSLRNGTLIHKMSPTRHIITNGTKR